MGGDSELRMSLRSCGSARVVDGRDEQSVRRSTGGEGGEERRRTQQTVVFGRMTRGPAFTAFNDDCTYFHSEGGCGPRCHKSVHPRHVSQATRIPFWRPPST